MKRIILALVMLLAIAGSTRAQEGRYETIEFNSAGRFLAGLNVSVCTTLATTAASVTNNVATLTMASNPQTAGFLVGFPLTVSGFTGGDTYFNVTATIIAVNSTTISYTLVHANASAGTSGIVYMTGSTTQACAPLTTLFTDNTGNFTSPNPFVSDGLGNVGFWAASGPYFVQTYGPTVTTSIKLIGIGCVPGSSTSTCGVFLGGNNNFTSIDTVVWISPGNPQGWAGTDITGWLTSAISCVSAATGCPTNVPGSTKGGRIEIAAGTYLTNGVGASTITLTQPVDIVGSGWATNIQLASGVGATPLLRFGTTGFCGGSIKGIQFSTQSGTPGTYALEFDSSLATNAFCKFTIDNIRISSGFGTNAIWLNNTVGEPDGGWFDSTIKNSYIFGGILGTAIGDSNVIDNNLITDVNGGAKQSIGVDVSFTAGSSSFRLSDGTINTQGAGLHVGAAATYLHTKGMEFETPNSTVACSNGAYVDIDGTMANPANGTDFLNDSFQIVNSSTCNGLRINWANNTAVLEKNDWTLGVGAKGIVTTANPTNTRIDRQNCNGATIANFLSDGASPGQTLYTFGGQNLCNAPLVYRDNNGTTTVNGFGANPLATGANGVVSLYDGAANLSAAAAGSMSALATPSGLKTGFIAAGGAQPVVTGTGACATSDTPLGGMWSGSIRCTGAGGAATITFTFPVTATNFWKCEAYDATTFTDPLVHGTHNNASCTFSAAALAQNDVVSFSANMY